MCTLRSSFKLGHEVLYDCGPQNIHRLSYTGLFCLAQVEVCTLQPPLVQAMYNVRISLQRNWNISRQNFHISIEIQSLVTVKIIYSSSQSNIPHFHVPTPCQTNLYVSLFYQWKKVYMVVSSTVWVVTEDVYSQNIIRYSTFFYV